MSFAEIIGSVKRAKKHTAYITRAALRRMLSLPKHAEPAARFAALAADLVRHKRRVRAEQPPCDWRRFERGFARRAHSTNLIWHAVIDVKSDASDDTDGSDDSVF